MCSMASAVHRAANGIEPNMQMTCRDRNRMAIQSDLLGAPALGIRNLLCLTGDHKLRQPPRGQERPRPGFVSADPDGARRCATEEVPVRRRYQRVEPRSSSAPPNNPFADPFDSAPYAWRRSRGRRRFRPDAAHLQRTQVQEVDGGGSRPGPAQGDQDPRRHHATQGCGRRPVHAEVRPRHRRASGHRRPYGGLREGRPVAGRRQEDRRRDHQGVHRDRRCRRRAHHGYRVGDRRARDRRGGRPDAGGRPWPRRRA